MKNVRLYVVTHKALDQELSDRTLIGVGNHNDLSGVQIYDNTGDQIAAKNPNYCELTALYWIWKNDTSDIVGLEHYRRQFMDGDQLLRKDQVQQILETHDIILPRAMNSSCNLYDGYSLDNAESDLILTRKIMEKKYPEYISAFDHMKRTNRLYVCNMMITSREILNDYCSWLFDILFEVEKHVDLSQRTDYQKRMFGFLSERLLNVYVYKNSWLKIKEIPFCEPKEITDPTQQFRVSREVKYWFKVMINYKGIYR